MIFFKYLAKEVIGTLLAVTVILLIIFVTTQFVHYLTDAAAGKITLQTVMKIMSLQVPLLLGYLLPLGLFLSVLLVLGRLSMDHEIVVMLASGMSWRYLIVRVFMIAVVVSGIVGWLMLVQEPKIQEYRAKILAAALTNDAIQKILPGRFQPFGNEGRVFYATSTNHQRNVLYGIFLAKVPLRTQQNWDVVTAKSARQIDRLGGRFILFEQGFRYVGVPGKPKFTIMRFDQYGIRLDAPQIARRIEAMPSSVLWNLKNTDPKAGAELQWRLAMPISVLIFALLAISLSRSNPRKGKFAQLLPAILIYVVYANLLFVGRTWLESGSISLHWGLWWAHGLLLGFTIVLLSLQFFGKRKWVFT